MTSLTSSSSSTTEGDNFREYIGRTIEIIGFHKTLKKGARARILWKLPSKWKVEDLSTRELHKVHTKKEGTVWRRLSADPPPNSPPIGPPSPKEETANRITATTTVTAAAAAAGAETLPPVEALLSQSPLPTMLLAVEADLEKMCSDELIERMLGPALAAAFDSFHRETERQTRPAAATGAAAAASSSSGPSPPGPPPSKIISECPWAVATAPVAE